MKISRVKVSRIISVFDGDTFRCDVDTWPVLFGRKIPVRIRGIDCPERRGRDSTTARAAIAAKEFTKTQLINARSIILSNVERGKYFRIIADVEIDGRDLASELLANGLAVRYADRRLRNKELKNENDCKLCQVSGGNAETDRAIRDGAG